MDKCEHHIITTLNWRICFCFGLTSQTNKCNSYLWSALFNIFGLMCSAQLGQCLRKLILQLRVKILFFKLCAHWQHSKLTFSKSCLLATFSCKMVAIKKILVTKTKLIYRGGHFVYVTCMSTTVSDTLASSQFKLILGLHIPIEKEKEKDQWYHHFYFW